MDLSKHLLIYLGFLLIPRKKHFSFTKDLAEVDVGLKDLSIRYYYCENFSKNVVKVTDCNKKHFDFIVAIIV